jgi:hypothetical protein
MEKVKYKRTKQQKQMQTTKEKKQKDQAKKIFDLVTKLKGNEREATSFVELKTSEFYFTLVFDTVIDRNQNKLLNECGEVYFVSSTLNLIFVNIQKYSEYGK